MSDCENFINNKINEATASVPYKDIISFLHNGQGTTSYKLALFSMELLLPLIFLCFPTLFLSCIVLMPLIILKIIINNNTIFQVTTFFQWILNQRPIVIWMLCFISEYTLLWILSYKNAFLLIYSQLYVIDYFYSK